MKRSRPLKSCKISVKMLYDFYGYSLLVGEDDPEIVSDTVCFLNDLKERLIRITMSSLRREAGHAEAKIDTMLALFYHTCPAELTMLGQIDRRRGYIEHALGYCGLTMDQIRNGRKRSRLGIDKLIALYSLKWCHSYGGYGWLRIAKLLKVLMEKGEVDERNYKEFFPLIDTLINLEHNTGLYLFVWMDLKGSRWYKHHTLKHILETKKYETPETLMTKCSSEVTKYLVRLKRKEGGGDE